MRKIELTIKRENGNIDIVNVSEKFVITNNKQFTFVKDNIESRTDNTVLEAKYTHTVCNLKYLVHNYNELNNEGGEGYIPESSYFEALPEYCKMEIVEVFK